MIKFPPNWKGELPPPETRARFAEKYTEFLDRRRLTPAQREEVFAFLEQYEERYYEAVGGQCYHRACQGAAVVQGELGVYCAKCGKLPDHFPPQFMR